MYALLLYSLASMELTYQGRPLTAWVEQLRSPDVRDRAAATHLLFQLGSAAKSAVPALCKLLSDPDPSTRQLALHGLGFIGPDAVAAVVPLLEMARLRDAPLPSIAATLVRLGAPGRIELLKAFDQRDANLRKGAVVVLRSLRPLDRDLLEHLRTRLARDDDAEVRAAAAITYGAIPEDSTDVVSPLIAAIKDRERSVREAVASGLAGVGALAIPRLTELLADRKNPDRVWAALALSKMGNNGEKAVPELAKALDDPLPEVRRSCARALAGTWVRARPAAPALAKLLADVDVCVRLEAAIALYRLDNRLEQAGPIVLDAVRKGDVEARRAAVTFVQSTYGQIRNGEAVLVEGMRDLDPLVRQVSAWAANLYRPPSDVALVALGERLKDRDARAREAAVNSLYQLRLQARSVLPAVVEALATADPPLRAQLSQILQAHPKEAIPLLTARLGAKEENVRVAVLPALASFGAEAQAILPAIAPSLQDGSLLVRMHAVAATAQLSDKGKVPLDLLEKVFKERDVELRRAAAALLADLEREPAALRLVGVAFEDEDAEVRRLAVVALSDFGVASRPLLSALTKRLLDSDLGVRLEAVRTFKALGRESEAVLPWLIRGLNDSDNRIRDALVALARGLVKDLDKTLLEALRHADAGVRAGAVAQLGRKAVPVGPMEGGQGEAANEHIVKELLRATADRAAEVRRAAVVAVRLWGRQRQLPLAALRPRLAELDAEVRRQAALAFVEGKQTPEEALPVLVEVLRAGPKAVLPGLLPDESSHGDFERALQGVQEFGPRGRRVASELEKLLEDPRGVVSKAATQALEKLR